MRAHLQIQRLMVLIINHILTDRPYFTTISVFNSRYNIKLYILRIQLFLCCLCIGIFATAQVKLKRNGNSSLELYSQTHPVWNSTGKLNKWGKKDTLNLPFFDDFVTTKFYPDSSKWFNNYVFVNNDFPINPPSYGVATFDDLNAKGAPYNGLDGNSFGACDTLLSLAINLRDSSGKLFRIADSIYFSFYFQRQGLGDPSDSKDSLLLQFKDSTGKFNTVWKAIGGSLAPFQFAILGITQTKYLFKGFQFRFINFSRHTGNMNQWHVDYIHLARKRSALKNYYTDFAIQNRPNSLLKNYFQMPYSHFLADASAQTIDSIYFNASNLDKSIWNLEARHIESHNGNTLVSTNFIANAANVPAKGFAKRRFPVYDYKGLTGDPVIIKREYFLRDPSVTTANTLNDKLTVYQEFNSCYAYDDGTAEYGFGYDDDVVDPFYKGAIAYKFNLTKADTLWGIGMFFNRSVKSSAAITFDLKVWQSISPTGSGRTKDVLVYTMPNLKPVFTDSVNGFHVFYIDTTLLLGKGDFYIGWEQTGNYHLDVGYDINNGYHATESSNNLFWSDRGNWYPVNYKGALMMRPYVGAKKILGPATVKNTRPSEIKVFPNPFENQITVQNNGEPMNYQLMDINGVVVLETSENVISTETIKPGVYMLVATQKNGVRLVNKIIKLQ